MVLGYFFARIQGLIVVGLPLLVGYIIAVRFNPRIAHRACGGTGRRAGWIYTSPVPRVRRQRPPDPLGHRAVWDARGKDRSGATAAGQGGGQKFAGMALK